MPPSSAQDAYQTYADAFTRRNPTSKQLYNDACNSLPGGNARTVLYYAPFPLAIDHARDSKLYDVDGHAYVDLLGEYTAGLYGHSDPIIAKAITDAVDRGVSFGGQHADEGRLADLIKLRFPSMELLRFTNSGTEANLMALAAARVYTGKSKMLTFGGAYHGGVLSFKGAAPSSITTPYEYLIAKYNDSASVKALLEQSENANDLAAIIVEPMIGSGGGMKATHEFLRDLRHLATAHGAVLIFDEVMTSRFHSGGGVQSQLAADSRPDLTTLGKWIGGGMSFGAFGGKSEIMAMFDPRSKGHVAHAGTFNNNVLTMAAGRAGLEHVFTPARAEELHRTGDELRERLRVVCLGTHMQWTGDGSILCIHFTSTPADRITCPEDLASADHTLGDLFHLFLLERAFYIGRRGFIALSLAVTQTEIDDFVNAVESFVQIFQPLVVIK